jgi:hypothetical protein
MLDARDLAAEILRAPEGERTWLSLVDYATNLARRYGWRNGMALPQGYSPDGIAKDVVIKVLEGQREWDPSKEPSLLGALKGMVKSDIGHLHKSYETRQVEPIAQSLPDGSERTAEHFELTQLNPEEKVLRAEEVELEVTALDLIREEVERKPELESEFLALYETGKSEEIARLTGLPVERVYALRRELIRIAGRITPERVVRAARERKRRNA